MNHPTAPPKGFDCVEMKRRIQERIYAETRAWVRKSFSRTTGGEWPPAASLASSASSPLPNQRWEPGKMSDEHLSPPTEEFGKVPPYLDDDLHPCPQPWTGRGSQPGGCPLRSSDGGCLCRSA